MNGSPALPPPIDIRNRLPIFGWVFISIFLGFNAIFTYILGRDGPPPSAPAPIMQLVLGAFWIVGVTVAGHLWSIPVTRLTQAPGGGLCLTSRTPIRRREEHFPRAVIAAVEVVQGRDDEGDPYWRTELVLADGTRRVLREGHDQQGQQVLAARLRQTLGMR